MVGALAGLLETSQSAFSDDIIACLYWAPDISDISC